MTLYDRLSEYMLDDMDVVMDYLEENGSPVVSYVSGRVGDIMHEVNTNMEEHPGELWSDSKTETKFHATKILLNVLISVLSDFSHMMMALPLVTLVINAFGAPPAMTALMGMLVPMFLMMHMEDTSHSWSKYKIV